MFMENMALESLLMTKLRAKQETNTMHFCNATGKLYGTFSQ